MALKDIAIQVWETNNKTELLEFRSYLAGDIYTSDMLDEAEERFMEDANIMIQNEIRKARRGR